jgi:hypothetical protein
MFKELTNFPMEQPTRNPSKKSEYPIHDSLKEKLEGLIPNIDIGYQMNMEADHMIDWIDKAKQYTDQLQKEFHALCEKRVQKIIQIEEQKQRAKELNLELLVKTVPDDVLRYIHGFLLPETRLQLLRARHPLLLENTKKLNVKSLKHLLKHYQKKVYEPMMKNIREQNRTRCLPADVVTMSFTYKGKERALETINRLIGICEGAKAYTKCDHRYFQKKALRLTRSLVYLLSRKEKLGPVYAPEQEQEQEKKLVKDKKGKKQRIHSG